MKIVSLLPSATEIVFALALADSLCGVTFECDHPADARLLPRVSGTALPTDGDLTPAEIDAEVTARVAAGESIYTLDRDRIASIDPDLILTQDLCRVCAVPSGDVADALDALGCHAAVVSLDPHRLDEVIACVGTVADATPTACSPGPGRGSSTGSSCWPMCSTRPGATSRPAPSDFAERASARDPADGLGARSFHPCSGSTRRDCRARTAA